MAVYRPTYTDQKTGEQKESRVWWYEFLFAGKRVRESAKTTRKTVALEAEKRKRLDLERAYAGLPSEAPGKRIQSVAEALAAYAKAYPVNHRRNSVIVVEGRSVHLNRLLGSVLLPDLTEERIVSYMERRQKEEASGRTINLELLVLSRAMGHKWSALWPKVKKLEENHDTGRAIEPEEEERLLAAAAKNPSPLIYPFLMTLAWTGMRSDEARTLRWLQVDFEAGQVVAGRAKTDAGTGRVIPMSGALRAALEHHMSWCAQKLGPVQPDWYVFPRMNRTRPVDATAPVSSLKTAWDTVRTDAKVECRLHDLRHGFCTKLGEAGVPERTMLDMMGHVSTAMLQRYSHIRARARRDAITALEAKQNSVGVPQESPKLSDFGRKSKTVTH